MNYFYIIVLLAIYFCFSHDSKKKKTELIKTRKELDKLAMETGNPQKSPYYVRSDIKKELKAMIMTGQKNRAVKVLKSLNGLDLTEAKMIADSLEIPKESDEIEGV